MAASKKIKPFPKGIPQPGNRRLAKSIAMVVRDKFPAEVMVEWMLAILQNHDPWIERDSHGGWRVMWNGQGEVKPDLKTKIDVAVHLKNIAHGLPVQQLVLDAEIRQQALIGIAGIDQSDASMLTVEGRARVLEAIQRALSQGGPDPSLAEVEDAELVNVKEQDVSGPADDLVAESEGDPEPDE